MHDKRYHASVLKHDKESAKRKPFPWRRVLIILSILLVCAGIIVFIKTPQFQVQKINVVGTNVADPTDVSQFVMEKLQGEYLLFLPKTSILLISPDQMKLDIKAAFPRFKTVLVDRQSMNALKITVTEYPSVYLWCTSDEACSFMDEAGTVFADAPYFSGSAYLKMYIGDKQDYPFHPITAQQLALVGHITERLKAIDIAPLSFSFDSEHKLSVVFVHGSSHTSIFFDPSTDIDAALETLYSGLRTEPMAGLYHNPSKVLQYLDVRFANKLIYKFQ